MWPKNSVVDEGNLKSIPYSPTKHGAAIHDFLDPRHGQGRRLATLTGGYGSGKSMSLCFETIRQAVTNAPVPVGVVSPEAPIAKRTVIPEIISTLSAAGIHYDYNKKDSYLTIGKQTGQLLPQIMFMSAHDPSSLKGPNLSGIMVDEAALCRAWTMNGTESTFSVLQSRLRAPKAKSLRFLFVGTPEGVTGMLYDLAVKRIYDGPQLHVNARTRDNHYLPLDVVRSMEAQYAHDPKLFRSFMLGEFVDFAVGGAFDAFRLSVNCGTPPAWDCARDAIVALDNNARPCVGLVGQMHNGVLWVYDAFSLKSGDVSKSAATLATILVRRRHNGQVQVHGDPVLRHGQAHGDTTLINVVLRTMAEHGVRASPRVRPAAPQVQPSVVQLNRAFAQRAVMLCSEGAKLLAEDIQKTQWSTSEHGHLDKRDREATHLADALRYTVDALEIAAYHRPKIRVIGGA